MRAQVGDRICVNSRTISQPPRMGTVLEVREGATQTRYRVAWDDGNESMFMPSVGAALVIEEGMAGQPDAVQGTEKFGCHIDVSVTETDGDCDAIATLMTPRGSFRGHGHSRRHPDDPSVPMIGEELAIGRALTDLGDHLRRAAMEAIEDRESRPIHLLEPS